MKKAVKRVKRNPPIDEDGTKVIDKGDYFLVIWCDLERSTYRKSPDGFATKEELTRWLNRNP